MNGLIDIMNLKNRRVVFWGTGRIAQEFYKKYCMEQNIISSLIYWCDNEISKQGTFLYGKEIISPTELKDLTEKEYRQDIKKEERLAVIIAATGHNLLHLICQFEQMAIKAELFSAPHLHAKKYFSDNKNKLQKVEALFKEEKSRKIYQKMIFNMQMGNCVDFSLVDFDPYVDNDIIPQLNENDVIVDAGVWDGSEIDKFLKMNAMVRIHAFEPDHNSMEKLKVKYDGNTHVNLYEYALWNERSKLSFTVNNVSPSASRLSKEIDGDAASIATIPLDEIIQEKITFIKMDIEGAEYKALEGARHLLQRYRPKLAICVYHSIEDYVEIPLLIKEINPEYEFYFRQHSVTSGESVLYAI